MNGAHAAHAHWCLVGPWYRWPRPGLPDDGRVAAPALQKFAGNDFIAQFLRQPQRSLQYDEVVDVVQAHDLVAAGKFPKAATLFALDGKGDPVPGNYGGTVHRTRLAPGSLRKLYQPTHDRHYVVSCELHCDEPGFPRVARQKVCQAGFVVRRRRSHFPPGLTASDLEAQVAPVRRAEAELFELRTLAATAADPSLPQALRDNTRARMNALAGAPGWDAWYAARRADLAARRAALAQWQQQAGIQVRIDGWFPLPGGASGAAQRGEWKPLDAAAQLADIVSGEQTYPLYPLVPDPREATHDAAGRTLYYGVVPTQDLQHDADGRPHFDDRTTYELRCFVRAHHDCPPKHGRQPDCNGPLTWSRPSEAFRVAPAFDVLGSANRPVTIQMPDLRDLAAQAAQRPRGKLSPVRFVQPQHLSPRMLGGAAICSFSIPLITIVALFVLNLFLPIVVFLFQLWFLLVFRFCIPPQVSLSMKVDAALAMTPPGIDLEADLAIEVEGVKKTAAELKALLTDGVVGGGSEITLEDIIDEDTGHEADPDNGESLDLRNLSNSALGSLNQAMGDNKALQAAPEVGEPLVYEPPVTPVWPARSAK